jgi:hypothetical protein
MSLQVNFIVRKGMKMYVSILITVDGVERVYAVHVPQYAAQSMLDDLTARGISHRFIVDG